MKKIYILLASAFGMMLPLLFTSCEVDHYYYDDPWYYDYHNDRYNWRDRGSSSGGSKGSSLEEDLKAEAQYLRGHWSGLMKYSYTEDNGSRGIAEFNADMEFDLYPESENTLRGRGREIDTAGNESQELTYSWYIDENNGNIYIRYDDTGKTFVLDIQSKDRGFHLDKSNFNGFMIGTNSDDVIQFDFQRYTYSKEGFFEGKAKAKKVVKPTSGEFPWKYIKR